MREAKDEAEDEDDVIVPLSWKWSPENGLINHGCHPAGPAHPAEIIYLFSDSLAPPLPPASLFLFFCFCFVLVLFFLFFF